LIFSDLRTFIDQLRRDRDLVEITAPVDPNQEAAEIHRRVIAAGGPALLFTNVKGADFPLVTNLFGTARRAQLAFGQRPLDFIKRLVHLAETVLPPTPAKLWGARDIGLDLLKVGMRRTATGPVREVVTSDVRLDRLPVITSWPEDGGPFVTFPLVYTQHPAKPGHNLGMYRLHVHDRSSTGMHWQIGKGGGFHYALAEQKGEALPVTVFLGGPPALILSAIAPLPENLPELMLASLIAGERLDQVAAPNGHPHPLIAKAEFALMGQVAPKVRKPEGPFGDHYGYYSLQHDYPVFNVRQIAHRKDAIYPGTVVGKPRQEDFYIGDLLQELLSPLFPLVMPAVEQLWSYGETGYHSLGAAVVKQRYQRPALAHEIHPPDRSAGGSEGFSCHAGARAGAYQPADRPLRILEPVHGHPRLHGPRRQRGLEGRVAGTWRSNPRVAAQLRAAGAAALGRDRCPRLLWRVPGGRHTAVRRRSRGARAHRFAPGFCRVAADCRQRRAGARDAQRHELPLDHVYALRTGCGHPFRIPARCPASHYV
jgi:UbiD family decarboxylase